MNRRIAFTVLIILGLVMMESPIILFVNKVEPTVMGMPFLLFWILFWWAFCTIVFLVAYRMNWGKNKRE